MSIYSLKRYHLMHEGGTKFYDFYTVTSLGTNRGVRITHWGPFPSRCPAPDKFASVITKCKLHEVGSVGQTGTWLMQAARGKIKRGYNPNPLGAKDLSSPDSCIRFDSDSLPEFIEKLVTVFGPGKAGEIVKALDHSKSEAPEGADSMMRAPKAQPAPTPEPVRPALWGSW